MGRSTIILYAWDVAEFYQTCDEETDMAEATARKFRLSPKAQTCLTMKDSAGRVSSIEGDGG